MKRQRRMVAAAVGATVALLVALLPTAFVPASAAEPTGVSMKLEGCRANSDTITDNVCLDTHYTTGNLDSPGQGPSWNELDLVPHRLTTSAGNSAPDTQTYNVTIAVDNEDAGKTGYDVLSVPVLNTTLSDPSCELTAVGSQVKTAGGSGGTDFSLTRELTITQDDNTECVFDYYARLAIGASLYSGSSLHSNVSAGTGDKDISIPVNAIKPQSISKTMTASRDANHLWSILKGSTPVSLDFDDTCSTTASDRDATIAVTVTWTKNAASPTGFTVLTTIYATNPAHRTIRVNVTDVIKSGTDVLHTKVFSPVDVPANTANYLIGTHSQNVAVADVDDPASPNFNDTASATYTDLLTGVPVPGTSTATASVANNAISSGTTTNATATVSDSESITGSGLTFAVAAPSSGSFSGYTAGTFTTGPVVWNSGTLSSSGSVTFNKTVRAAAGTATSSGELSDTATLTPSHSTAQTADLDIDITSSATTVLTIDKTIPDILQTGESVSFTFKVYAANTTTPIVHTEVITFTAGQTNKTADIDLPPGIYDLVEESPAGWAPQDTVQDIDLRLPNCDETVVVVNNFGPATAKALKVTDPAGSENGWVVCLEGPGTEDLNVGDPDEGKECVTTATVDSVDGVAPFTTVLEEGDYTITEKQLTDDGWVLSSSTGDCSFTVDYPGDFDAGFVCTFTNSQNATVKVIKTTSGELAGAGDYTFQIREGADETHEGTILDTDTTDANGEVDFDGLPADGLEPGTYQLCEVGLPFNWSNDLVDSDEGAGGPDVFTPGEDIPNSDPDNSIVCIDIVLSAGEDLVVDVDNTPPPGGDARTIGYWKNWNTCTGGNQTDSLSPALGDGIFVGLLDVDTCQEAVSILNKSSLDGTKRASDPAYNLAAQFLAAELNVSPTNPLGGAASCAAADDAMDDAQALLTAVGFDGTRVHAVSNGKAKKGGTTYAMTAAQAAEANTLAGILDDYNNNELCP